MLLLSFNLSIPELKDRKDPNISEEQLISDLEHITEVILRDLELHSLLVTFFVEVSIADSLKKTLKRMQNAGHEISFYNIKSSISDLEIAKKNLQNYLEKPIKGIRQKLLRLPLETLYDMGFSYVSNIEHSNITFLVRRLKKDKTQLYYDNNLTIIPESLSPYSQLPFNDYVFQMTPLNFYENMILETLKKEDYIQIYLNAWQFYQKENCPYQLPFYKQFNLGKPLEDKMISFFNFIEESEIAIARMKDYLF